MSDVVYCSAVTYRRTWETPEEYCENEALEDSDFCDIHTRDYE